MQQTLTYWEEDLILEEGIEKHRVKKENAI